MALTSAADETKTGQRRSPHGHQQVENMSGFKADESVGFGSDASLVWPAP